MKALVLYDSTYGNTEKVAQAIAEGLGGAARVLHVKQATAAELQGTDLLVVGSPTVGFNALPPVRSWLDSLPASALAGKRVAAFDTRIHMPRWVFFARYAAPLLAGRLRKLGGKLIGKPDGFFVVDREGPLAEGEVARARTWGAEIGRAAGG
jgi:flavodoxin